MPLFNIFKSRKTKELEYLKEMFKIANRINQFVERRLLLAKKGEFVDLEFETTIFESNLVYSYNDHNCLEMIDVEYRNMILKVFSNQELILDDLDILNSFLLGFTKGIKMRIAEMSKS